jgi:glutamate synthase (ferredoxin)
MVDLEPIADAAEIDDVREMVRCHAESTGSLLAYRVLADWDSVLERFIKVMPKDYKRVLQAYREIESAGLSGEQAIMAAFELNSKDLVRATGN